MSINNPFNNNMGDFTHIDRSIPIEQEGKADASFNETIAELKKAGIDSCVEALSSLTPDQKSEIDLILNQKGEVWTLFSLVEDDSAMNVVQKIELFKNSLDKSERKKIILELINLI